MQMHINSVVKSYTDYTCSVYVCLHLLDEVYLFHPRLRSPHVKSGLNVNKIREALITYTRPNTQLLLDRAVKTHFHPLRPTGAAFTGSTAALRECRIN